VLRRNGWVMTHDELGAMEEPDEGDRELLATGDATLL
jgi:hypothetical protein